jgi:hypothetical protein
MVSPFFNPKVDLELSSFPFGLDESPLPVFTKSNSQTFLGVYDDRPVPGHGPSDGFAGYQEQAEMEARNLLERGLKKGA